MLRRFLLPLVIHRSELSNLHLTQLIQHKLNIQHNSESSLDRSSPIQTVIEILCDFLWNNHIDTQ